MPAAKAKKKKGSGKKKASTKKRASAKKSSKAKAVELAPVGMRPVADEVSSAFMEYSMSVIVSRALPDARDGLKPVHRRILWSMQSAGVRSDRPHVKCARVVGDVMGKFHPHGDQAIYDALVRLGQDFSLTTPLIDKHGNFGSPADPPAAARYTECRLAPIAEELLAGIDEGTVDFETNYDGSTDEPAVLPARFPNLLVNGGQGIAVGMATNVPPHNLGEVINGALRLIDKPNAQTHEIMRHIKGPDFPTGGLIMGDDGIKQAYRKGRGTLRLRAKTKIEESSRSARIIITEIPYQTSVDAIAGKLAEAVDARKVDGVKDIRNESGQGATRLVIELRSGANAQVVLNNIFKHTPAQKTFGVNMVALVDGVPKTCGLVELLKIWLEHQEEVVRRRSEFRKKKAEDRLHLVDGLVKAIDQIDAIVKLIRRSADRAVARKGLMGKKFGFSEIQANYILDMPLGRLTKLGHDELLAEQKNLKFEIRKLKKILADHGALLGVIEEELKSLKSAYADKRRTEIVGDDTGDIDADELVAKEDLFIAATARGHLKAIPVKSRSKKMPSAGKKDVIAYLANSNSMDSTLVFTSKGRAFRVPNAQITKDKFITPQTLWDFKDGENVVATFDSQWAEDHEHLVFVTSAGNVKRTVFEDFFEISTQKNGVSAMKLKGDEAVVSVFGDWGAEVMLVTEQAKGIRFPEEEIRVVSRSAGGIRGMKLAKNDRVVGACAAAAEESIVIATEFGHAKRVKVDDFPVQARAGAGVKVAKIEKKRGSIATVSALAEEISGVTSEGTFKIPHTTIRIAGREATGTLMDGYPGGELLKLLPTPEEPLD